MSASGGARLDVEGLVRTYGTRRALDEVTFSLAPGEFLVVLGPNGAGKTTLVKAIARLLRPTAGRIRLDGEDWLGAPGARQREIGVLSHATWLYDDLTAIENLRFYGALYGLAEAEGRARAALERVGLAAAADRRAGALSRGQAQRLSIARAILHDPRLLLLDEPFAGLDPHGSARLAEALDRLAGEGRTILLTTHEVDRAPAAAGRYLVLVEGRVALAGSRAETPDFALRSAYERAVERAESGRPERAAVA